jgi:methionine synthase II (cobalamin-independent)
MISALSQGAASEAHRSAQSTWTASSSSTTTLSGDFDPLRFGAEDKQGVLGVVTTKTGKLEDKDELKRRIDKASKYVPLEHLGVCPNAASPPPWRAND